MEPVSEENSTFIPSLTIIGGGPGGYEAAMVAADAGAHVVCADLDLTVSGAPLRLRGTIDLTPAGNGARMAVAADLTCSIPLVGKKVEQAAQPAIIDSIDAEARFLAERLV